MLIGVLIHSSSLLPFVLFTLVFLFESKIKALHLYLYWFYQWSYLKLITYLFSTFFWEYKIHILLFLFQKIQLVFLNYLLGVCIFVLLHYDKMKETYFIRNFFNIYGAFSSFTNIFAFQIQLTRFSYFSRFSKL
jgi:hypothetical protein